MDTKTIIYVAVAGFGAILGCYIFVFRHLANHRKHPCKDDIVFKDTCEAQRDCLETEIKGLKEFITEKFKHLETLIKNARPR